MPLEMLEQTATTAGRTAPPPPMEAMIRLLFGKHITYALSAVARLGVADEMNEEPIAVSRLAERVSANSAVLYRVMRVLAGVGIFDEISGKKFSLTPLGALLKTDAPGSIRYLAIQLGDEWSVRAFEHFTDTVRTGINGVNLAYGKNVFELFVDMPEQAQTFNRSMSQLSAALLEPIVSAYDFSTIGRLADVGGGHGLLLSAILQRNPLMTGVVYDLPEVVAGAFEHSHFTNCGDRIQAEGGSFFERVPSGCDAYLMKFIVHDWSDDHCKKILGCIREQLPPNGRVLVVEQVVRDQAGLSPAKLLDLEMLTMTVGGRERTPEEFTELFASAGLRLNQIIQTQSPVCILEACIA